MLSVFWLDSLINTVNDLAPAGSFFSFGFNVRAMLALFLVSLCCGAIGTLVVGGRMAFFSDALAHCAFLGVSLGFVLFTLLFSAADSNAAFWDWVIPVMLAFGVLVGLGIAWVKERTGLASDTIIGVFFAFAIGLTAMLRKIMQARQLFSLEDLLFGDPLLVRTEELLWLLGLVVVTGVGLYFVFNYLLLSGFNSSLALSRRVPSRLSNYLFIALLALIVNLSVRTVGVLLINALLVVPAATAANVSRNLRQVFWLTMAVSVFASFAGQLISWEIETRTRAKLGIPGTVILVLVVLFTSSVIIRMLARARDLQASRAAQAARESFPGQKSV
jgi:zinc transport system permease protein